MGVIKCLRCKVQSDDWVLEEDEMPVCDECSHKLCKRTVKYDGSKDLVEHLKTELKGSRCPYCYEESAELDRIRYGSPVDAFMKCDDCGITHIFDVHVEFV